MHLRESQIRRLEDAKLTTDERARLRCATAKRLVDSGNIEGAREAFGDLWQRLGSPPNIQDLDAPTKAEVILRVGELSGWIASATQNEVGQEPAKDLLSLSCRLFKELGQSEKVAESQIELSYCYWREGNYDESLVWLREAIAKLTEEQKDLRALAYLRMAIVTFSKGDFRAAVSLLEDHHTLFENSQSHSLKGRYRVNLATFLKKIAEIENNEEMLDRSLIEYAAASYHLELARHHQYQAGIENQLGYLFSTRGDFAKAHEHLNRARKLFISLRDKAHISQVDETRAQTYLRQKKNAEAEKAARSAVHILQRGGQQALLSESLTTLGIAQARLGHFKTARFTLRRASEIAEQVSDLESAAKAEITTLEELRHELTSAEMAIIYARADQHLEGSKNSDTLARLRVCASFVINEKKQSARKTKEEIAKQNKEVKPEELLQSEKLSEPDLKIKWEGFSLDDAVYRLKTAYIERALHDAGGSVIKAQQLLGIKHHQTLSYNLKKRENELGSAKPPSTPRRKSLMKKSNKKN